MIHLENSRYGVKLFVMKTLVLYTSKYGSTEAYAKEIAERVNADIFPLKKFKWKTIDQYDIVLFGGWVKAGTIEGINDFLSADHWKRMENKSVLVFASGMSIPDKNSRTLLIESNLLDEYHIRFYQLRGSFDFSKLNFLDRMLIGQSINGMYSNPETADKARDLEWVKENPILAHDTEKIDKICSVIMALKTGALDK